MPRPALEPRSVDAACGNLLGEAVSVKYDEFTELSPLHR
jgi:hypothetical protein